MDKKKDFEKNTKTIGKWLITRGETSLLRIQKLMFFLRVEELKNNDTKDSYFKDKDNFEAWVYGPVNTESFWYLHDWYYKLNELEVYLLDEHQMSILEKRYGKYLKKYEHYTPNELVDLSHKNLAWKNARKNYGSDEICKEILLEDKSILEFED